MPPPRPTWYSEALARASAAAHATTDRFFGTRRVTPGAALQLPRKAPLRIEPKTYFANERTFLSWLSMAVSLGGVSSALVGFTAEEKPGAAPSGPLTPRTVAVVTASLLPVSIVMVGYALFIFLCRSESLRTKQLGFFTDMVGPVGVAALLLFALMAITIVAFVSVLRY